MSGRYENPNNYVNQYRRYNIMEYKEIITLIKRAIKRIQANIIRYNEYESRLALIDIGKELRQIEAIIDEA